MAGRHDEAQAASKTGLLSCRDFLDLDAMSPDAAGKSVEFGVTGNLEPGVVHSRRLR
jgi:hypothetical protein